MPMRLPDGHELLELRSTRCRRCRRSPGCGDDALGHVVGRHRDVLDGDAGVGLDLLRRSPSTGSPPCRGSAASPAPAAMHRREAHDGPRRQRGARQRRRALQRSSAGASSALVIRCRPGRRCIVDAALLLARLALDFGSARRLRLRPRQVGHARPRRPSAPSRASPGLTGARDRTPARAATATSSLAVRRACRLGLHDRRPGTRRSCTVAASAARRRGRLVDGAAAAGRRAPRACAPPSGDHVVPADEARHELACAARLNTSRGVPCLLDAAVVHHHHEVGQRHGLVLRSA